MSARPRLNGKVSEPATVSLNIRFHYHVRSISVQQKLKSLAIVSTAAAGLIVGLNIIKGNERFYDNVLMPVVRRLPPEFSHQLAVFACKHRLFPAQSAPDASSLVRVCDLGREVY